MLTCPRALAIVVPAVLLAAGDPLAAQAGCGWAPGIFPIEGVDGEVWAQVVFDDGTGPKLYAGGAFTGAGPILANRIASWDGVAWSALGAGFDDGEVRALAVHDAGSGPAIYAGGTFTTSAGVAVNHIARWTGTAWVPLGSGCNGPVAALASYNSGSGSALFAGGTFGTAGGLPAPGLAIHSANSWSAVAGSITAGQVDVRALAVHDDGSGPALYAGGAFTGIGGVAAPVLARWDGTSWSAVGTGLPLYSWAVVSTLLDAGTQGFYIGGRFGSTGTAGQSTVARWNGATWNTLDVLYGQSGQNAQISSFAVFDPGTGPALFAGGVGLDNLSTVSPLWRWTGAGWLPELNYLAGHVRSLAIFTGPSGPRLVAGGSIGAIGTSNFAHIAVWTGATWGPLGGMIDFEVRALAVHDAGGGPALYAGGTVASMGGTGYWNGRLGRWNGTGWTDLNAGLDGPVEALADWNDGTGPALYVAGRFTQVGGIGARGIARWNGAAWTPLGTGLGSSTNWGSGYALETFDDGAGTALYVGGSFFIAGGVAAQNLARWDGAAWSPVGGGVSGPYNSATVRSLHVFDHGTGAGLIVGGTFSIAGGPTGLPAFGLARWDGAAWSAPALGGPAWIGTVEGLEACDLGPGPALYVAGEIHPTVGGGGGGVLRWDGTTWSGLGGGIPLQPGVGYLVNDVLAANDGRGPALFSCGRFQSAGGIAAPGIARWDGIAWSALGTGLSGGTTFTVNALAAWDDGSGPALFAGGGFTRAGGSVSANLARWSCGGPALAVSQPGGPGAPVFVTDGRLISGRETYNVFTADLRPSWLSSGPWLGLCFVDPAFLALQLAAPLGGAPFHFAAPGTTATFGPYVVPPATFEGLCFDVSAGAIGRVSEIVHFQVQ